MSRIPTRVSRASSSDVNSIRLSRIRSHSHLGTRQIATPKRTRTPSVGGNLKTSSAVKQYAGVILSNKIKVKDTRPLQDKQWQSNELTKIQTYLTFDEGGKALLNQGITLHPLTIKAFVQICNFLLKKLGSEINITMANYAEELQSVLKKMQYPGMLSKALMITANVPRNWPSVLAIMSWLVDIVIEFEQEEIGVFQIDKLKWFECIAESYICWNNGESYEQIVEKRIEDFHKNIYEGVDKETAEMKLNSLKVDVARIEKKREHLKDEESKYKKVSEFRTQLKQQCIDLERVFEKALYEDIRLDEEIVDKNSHLDPIKENVEKLQEQVKSQPLNLCEHETLKNKYKDLKAEVEIIENRIKCFEEYIWSTELSAEQKKKELTELIELITCEILKFTMKFPDYNNLIIPEVNWTNPSDITLLDSTKDHIQTMIKDIQTKTSEKEECISKQEVRIGQLKYNIEEKEIELKNTLNKIDKCKKEMANMNDKYKEEIQKNLERLEELKKQCTNIKNSEPPIEKAMKELKDCEKKIKRMARQTKRVGY